MKVKSFSRIRLFVTPWTAAYKAPPSMGFSRQENFPGIPLVWGAIAFSEINSRNEKYNTVAVANHAVQYVGKINRKY